MRYLQKETRNRVGEVERVSSLVPGGTFPVIDAERGRGRVYLDSAATTQKPAGVLHAMDRFYRSGYAAVHRGVHRLSSEATEAFERARAQIGRFVGAASPSREVVLSRGATESINLVAHAWGDSQLRPGDEILLSTMEHHSNLVPWHLLARRRDVRLRELRPGPDGTLRAEDLAAAVTPRTRLVALAHVSNVLGTINDVKAAADAVHERGGLLLVDGAQAAGHLPVDVQEIGCDLYAASGHKMFGPTGIGFLYGRLEVLDLFGPFLGGGDMIEEVHFDRSTYREIPARLEAGTPPIAETIGLGAAVDFLQRLGMDEVRRHDRALAAYALERLTAIQGVEVYGPRDPDLRSGLVSFNIKRVHPHDAATYLDEWGVAVRAGHLCAQPIMRFLGISSCLRASFALYNAAADVDRLADGVERAARFFTRG